MAAFCVNTHSKLFKDTAKRLDISDDILELIAYKYGNQEGTFGKFPSDEYILNSLEGKQDVNASEAQIRLWELRYSQPRVFETIEEANQFVQDTQEYFDNDSIVLTTTNDGKFRVSVAEPFNQEAYQKEIDSIKEKAIADGTFMKVKNKQGELVDSNLNEQQWLQVRTKAFKRWFGDWENDPANASKVVDENGEPLMVWHSSEHFFTEFDLGHGGEKTGARDGRKGFFFMQSKEGSRWYSSDLVHSDFRHTGLHAEDVWKNLMKDAKVVWENYDYEAGDYIQVYSNGVVVHGDEWATYEISDINNDEDFNKLPNGLRGEILENVKQASNLPQIAKKLYNGNEYLNALRRSYDSSSGAYIDMPSGLRELVENDFVRPFFLNIRNIESVKQDTERKKSVSTDIDSAIASGKDGLRIQDTNDSPLQSGVTDVYVAFNPNQIKSATENRGTFSNENPNIYFGELNLDEKETTPNDRSKFKYTRINKAFKDTLLEHLKKDNNLGDYGYSASKRRALIDMTNALFDYFDREGYRIVITNNSIDSTGRGSAVTSFGKTVAIYYQDSPAQGGKYLNIVHELLHVATNQAISFESMGRDIADERLSAYYNLFIAKLNEDAEYNKYKGLILNAKSYEELDEKVPLKYQILDHAAESPGEFISMCVSNAEVQRTLESILWSDVNAPREGSLFQEIVRYLKDIISRIFRGSSYLRHVDFLDTVTEFLVDTRFVGEREQAFKTTEPEEYAKEQERWNQIWENASEFGTSAQSSQQGSINIWAGSNDNADLSNMAQRPFTYNGAQYTSVESAFQAAKFRYAAPLTQQPIDVQEAFNNPDLSAREAKKFGNKIVGLDQARWNADSPAIMKTLIKESFKQNPQALQRLLATGDAILTHTREREDSRWRTEFPRILMEVRSELRNETHSQLAQQVATQGTTQQYGVVIDSQLKSNYAQWQQQNPNGLVAYRVNYDRYNTPEEATAGRIGNPFSEGQGQKNKGADTVQKFFDWLTTGNNFGEAKATEEYRQAIIQKLLNTPVGTPILYYKELGRPSHATVLGYLINHKELIGDQQVTTTPETSSQEEPLWAPPSVEREFHTKEVDLVTKIDNLFSGDIDASEISAEANKAVDWISDQLTQYMEDHELVYKKFFEDNPSSPSKEEVMKKLDNVSSRKEMLETVGLDKMIEFYKEEVLSMTDENADIFDNMDDAELDKYDAIKDNIEGLIQLGYSRFLGREGFGFTISDVEGETFSVTEERSKEDQINPDDFNGQADIDGNEEVRNQQEHWQIENATRDIMDNASAKVKQAIADCYLLEDNGKTDENGNKKYDITRDNLNRNERVVPIQAVRSIVKWTQGALTLSQMVAKLESRLGTDPWISQIVTRLKDTTGNEADFQSQFFNTFCKHFQPYSIVKRRADGTFYTMVVNAHPALNDALNALSIQYKTGSFPLVNDEGVVQMSNVETLAALRDTLQGQGNLSEENRSDVVELIGRILETIGMPQPSDAINRILTNTLKDLVWANTKNIVEKLTAAANERGYNPFQYTGNKNGIRNYISNILRPFTNQLEDTLVSSVFDSGKMYQSYITPSWTTKLFTKMHLPDREFKQFILNEFGQSEWFIDSDALTELAALDEQGKLNYLQDNPNVWRLPWIGELMRMSEADRQKAFNHKVQLNFNKQNYMRGMNDLEYVMSVYTEYFAESSDAEKGVLFGNYRFPMISNKPSNEFIRFIRHTGIDGRVEILEGLTKIFHQELSRIQTVEMRNLKEGDAGFIANFDANGGKGKGLQFNFLDYLNEYLNGSKKDTALGKLIDRKLHATEANQLTSDELTELDSLVQKEIRAHLDGLADRLISQYKQNGLFEALKGIEHIGKTDAAVEDAIREFAWNDNYAQANILEMLVTDKAFYKNEEDLQKRLAQVHSPGIRGNWEATDFEGKPVSDGKVRVLKLADYAGIISDTIDNVEAVFDKKIAENPNDREGWEALKESVLAAYRDINVVDGQAFVSPTAYRKKAIAFGEWTKDDEEVYHALLQGKANLAQIKRVFNPRKPFTYGKVNKSVSAGLGTPIKTLNYGVQYKNSEYLLIMADALLRGQETGRPNLLGALFDVMEESAKSNPTRGIDFTVFESGVKTGLTGAISINEFIDDPNGREKAFTKLWSSAFKEDGSYNEDFIDVLDAEDYTTQQTVPEHFFLHGGLQWGSQIRAMATSDLETTFNGEPVLYEYVDPLTGKTIPMDAQTIRNEWERNTAAYIQKGIDELSEELGLNDNMSIADRNILISKLLQREILSNQRYGVDLLLACSVDENGNFRIPLGDPIQSKRIEQLLNSIVKNRINKQKVEGGNLVEVTNFGTSKKLEIRYKDKGGNLLTSKRDYLAQGHTEEEFKQYLKENQYGIAYHECYAPAWARDVFQKFADERGSVDVEAIRMLSPDLLKMFGYRIPTEDKYSTAPYMIVGFLPQEAGDGFMQPWETTVIDGSDFDVDKKNLMRMVLDLKSKLLSKREFLEKEGLTESDESTEKYKKYRRQAVSAKTIYDKLGDKADVSLSEEERKEIEWYEKSRYKRDRKALKEQRNARNEEAEEAFDRKYSEYGTYDLDKLDAAIHELENKEDLTAAEENKLAEYKKDYEERYDRLTKSVDKMRENNEKWYKEAVEKRRQKLSENIERAIEDAKRRKKIEIVRNILNEGVFRDSSTIPENQKAIFLAVKQTYLDSMFEVVRPKEGTKGYLNNKMFNMQWAIATHASTADKMLNPGNFDPQKRMGYMVAANRLGYSWSELEKMKTSAIKDLVFTSKNLMDFDVQTQFYKQNAVAGQILGIFAVAKSAHAMFEGRNYGVLVDSPFSIDGMEFNGAMHYDVKYDRNGVTLVGKHLGSLVGASADAVKDPVLNFMNINKETINVLNTALRLGLDFDTASLLLSSKAVSDVLDTYRRKSLSEKTSFDKEVRKALRDLEKKEWIGKDSPLKNQDLTKKEMIWAITGKIREGDEARAKQADQIVYKILNAVYQLSKLSQKAQPLTDLSRLNSVTSAPGPLHINTIASDRKLGPEISMDGIIRFKDSYKDIDGNVVSVGEFEGEGSYVLGVQVNRNNLNQMLLAGAIERFEDYDTVDREMVFDDIPSLRAFYRSYEIVKQLFKDLGFTTASDSFNKVLAAVPEDIEFSLYNKEKLLSSLADFFQSYILIQSGVIKSSWLKNYAQNFVKEYVKADYKSQERFRKNPLIQAIQPTLISKEGEPDRYALKIETTGMEQSEKDALSAGWIQLEKQDPELSHKLFVYNFFRGGIGFNPKTFMGLVPIQVKEKIRGYIEAYSKIPAVDGATVIDQWVRNNWMNNDLVTPVNLQLDPNADAVQIEKKYIYNTPTYIRTTIDGKNYLYRLTSVGDKSVLYNKIDPLGNNGEYLEMYETNATVSPFDNPQRGTLEIQESDHLEEKVDNPRTDQPTVEEQTRELVDFYQTAYDTESTQEREETSNDESFDRANKDLDITVNKDKFDEILEDFC